MTLIITYVRGKGGYNGGMTLKLSRCICVRFLHLCAKFHGSMAKSLRENPFGEGDSRKLTIDFSSNFHRSFHEFMSCFSTTMSQIDFLRLLMTGANTNQMKIFFPHNEQKEDWFSRNVFNASAH